MTLNGTPVNFGFTGAADANKNQGITTTGLSGAIVQSADQTKVGDLEVCRNGIGDEVAHGHYNIHDEATLEYVVTGAALIADAVANTVLTSPGTIINITACASMPSLVNTHWEVQSGCKITKTNTGFAKISIPMKAYPNITAAAS
jgi:hypothetical protein